MIAGWNELDIRHLRKYVPVGAGVEKTVGIYGNVELGGVVRAWRSELYIQHMNPFHLYTRSRFPQK